MNTHLVTYILFAVFPFVAEAAKQCHVLLPVLIHNRRYKTKQHCYTDIVPAYSKIPYVGGIFHKFVAN